MTIPTVAELVTGFQREGTLPCSDDEVTVRCRQCSQDINLASAVITEKSAARLYGCPSCANILVSVHRQDPERPDYNRWFGGWSIDNTGDLYVKGYRDALLPANPGEGCSG